MLGASQIRLDLADSSVTVDLKIKGGVAPQLRVNGGWEMFEEG